MAIEPGFQVRLGIYGIDQDVVALRCELWDLLAPHLDTIVDAHHENVLRHAPFYADKVKDQGAARKQAIIMYTEKLLKNPFDEQWVKDAYDRVQHELEQGFDMRSRAAISISILTRLNKYILERHRFSARKAFRLSEAATRIFMLDAANAVACHNSTEVQQAKTHADELGAAIRDFGRAIDGVRRSVGSAVESLSMTSDRLTELASAASGQANMATKAAEDTAFKISSIAAAAEELSAAIEEMHAQTTTSAKMTHDAVSRSDHATSNIRSLSETVEKIGSIVGMISKIAAQTNLLALNATIEAARAGAAGKGFAVVASEVKSLAIQTAKATGDVGKQIALIQEAMRRSLGETVSTGQTIADISAVAQAVAAIVSQQTGATNEIAKNVSGAAANARTVADALKTVEDTIQRTQDATKLVLNFSGDLSRRSSEIDVAMDTLFSAAARSSSIKKFANLAITVNR
jgi:methyl-accepting chemotaxis protein